MICNKCGEEFDPAHLALVFLHEHNEDLDPSIAMEIKGKQVKTDQEESNGTK